MVEIFLLLLLLLRTVTSQYIITLAKDQEAYIYCYSTMEKTSFTNRSCATDVLEPHWHSAVYSPDRICTAKVTYDELAEAPVNLTCAVLPSDAIPDPSSYSLTIPLRVLRGTRPKYNTTVDATESEYWCLENITTREITAGHLLSVSFNTSPRPPAPQFYKVELRPTWDYKLGHQFECNGTQYTLQTIYKCLQFVPTGWPCFTNCTIFHKIGITFVVICTFVVAYIVLCVGLCQGFSKCRGKKF